MYNMGYNFKSREVAEELKRIAQHKMGTTNSPDVPAGNVVIFVKAPTEGIDAINGTTITSGICTKMLINEGTTDTDLEERTEIEIEVYNTTGEDIGGNTVFQVARVGEYWVSLSGGGGGSSVKTFLTNSAITARSGSTAGTGTAVSYTYNSGTGNYDTGAESPPFDIINPYTSSVSTSTVIQCHAVGDKWEIIQSECEA